MIGMRLAQKCKSVVPSANGHLQSLIGHFPPEISQRSKENELRERAKVVKGDERQREFKLSRE